MPILIGRRKYPLFLGLRLIIFCYIVTPLAQAGQWIGARIVNPTGGKLYRDASTTSELLGTYPQGTETRVYSTPRNGFYSIYLSQPWKGVQYVWIASEDLLVKTPASKVPQSSETSVKKQEDSTPKSWSIDAGFGYTSILYKQALLTFDEQMTALTARLAFGLHPKSSSIKLAVDASYTLIPITQVPPLVSVRFLKTNAKAGFSFDLGPLELDLLGGLYYNNMMVSGEGFGYKPFVLVGAYPSLRMNLSKKLAIQAFMNYFPDIVNQMGTLEFTWGIGLVWKTRPNQALTAQFSASRFGYGDLNTNGVLLQSSGFELNYTF